MLLKTCAAWLFTHWPLEMVHLIVRASAVTCKVRQCTGCRPNMEQVGSFHAYWHFSSKPVWLSAACTRLECICTPDCCSAVWPLLGGFILQCAVVLSSLLTSQKDYTRRDLCLPAALRGRPSDFRHLPY